MNTHTQKIIPHLWFDGHAEAAADFYTSIFDLSNIGNITRYVEAGKEIHGQKPGSVMTVEFVVEGYIMVGLNGDPQFKLNPSISFMVNCPTVEEVSDLWEKFSGGGTALMPLDSYPFSKRYGWIQDKFGVTWQIIHSDSVSQRKIVPSLMYVGRNLGKAEDAARLYTSIFENSSVSNVQYYPPNSEPQKAGTVMYGEFEIQTQKFAIMDSAIDHGFTFNEAISLLVRCDTQEEVDYLWDSLTAVPEAEQCGWLKDKYGVSWQIVPDGLSEILNSPDQESANQAMKALLQMKKIDLNKLKQAQKGVSS